METNTKKFGLIGKTLKHSFSKTIHQMLGDYEYELYELNEDALEQFVNSKTLNGYNVTIPYKTQIIQYLDDISESAKEIGAVNTVVLKNGKYYGDNTDIYGMIYMFKRANIVIKDKIVMILGTGGTSKTARATARRLGAKEIIVVSRTGELNYDNYYLRADAEIIINTTPVGMYPDNYSCSIDLQKFNNLYAVADVVYNPSLTAFLYQAKLKGVKYTGGLSMLVAQAKYASEEFLCKTYSDEIIERIIYKLEKDKQNVVLVGMPGSGKTTVGKQIATILGKEFIDVDKEIERLEGKDIPTIFRENGEEYFRNLERKVVKEVGKLSGKVIATGGGVVKDKNNYFPLKMNGKIFLIERDLNELCCEGRPLSKDIETVKKLFDERKDMYEYFADCKVKNDKTALQVAEEVICKL